jgi:hypothetical protein
MENCLVTKLKSAVNNNELLQIGEIRIDVLSGAGSGDYIGYSPDSNFPVVLKVIGEGTLNTHGDTELIVQVSSAQYIETSSDIELSVGDIYDVADLRIETSRFDLQKLTYAEKIKQITSFQAFGNLSALYGKTQLLNIGINGSAVCGSIEGLSSSYKLTNINAIGCANINGSVEAFLVGILPHYAERQYNVMKLILMSTSCTLNNAPIGNILYVTFTSASSITIGTTQGASDVATYSNGSWSYN